MAHGDARERKWRGNGRMKWVASTLHTISEHGVSSITTADAHTSGCQQSTELTPPPGRFKWTRPFRAKDEIWFLRMCRHISNAVQHTLFNNTTQRGASDAHNFDIPSCHYYLLHKRPDRRCVCKVTLRRLHPLLQWKSKTYYLFWVCVYSCRYPGCSMRSIDICGLTALKYFSILSHTRYDFRYKKYY